MKWFHWTRGRKARPHDWKNGFEKEDAAKIAEAARLCPEVKDCVGWLIGDMAEQAADAAADARPDVPGYAVRMARLAGIMHAAAALETAWDAVCDGSLALEIERKRGERRE